MNFKPIPHVTIGSFVFAAAISLGCGGGGDGGVTGSQDANVTGTWDAAVTVTGGTQLPAGTQFSSVLTLVQSGNGVTGTSVTEGGLGAEVSGSISGHHWVFTIAQGAPCPGTFSGSATVDAASTQSVGSYSGSDCNGTLAASFVAARR